MRQLSQDEIDDVLVRQGVGVLAMAEGEQPYAIPMSFGYDSTKPVFPMQWGGGYEGRKNRVVESNPKVCLTVYEQDFEEEAIWRSVIITGELYEIPEEEEEQAFASIAANAQFPSDLGVWGIPLENVEFTLFGLNVIDCTGREFSSEYERWDADASE